jgi:tetratricopeptide (TPR) repeat protein
LSPGFTSDQLVNYLLASIENMRIVAESTPPSGSLSDVGIQVASPTNRLTFTSWRVAIPVFDQQVRGVSVGKLRQWAVFLKARRFIWLDATAAGGKNFRLQGVLRDRANFAARRSWRVPAAADPCLGFEACTDELAEEILAVLEPGSLVPFYLHKNQDSAFHKIVDLYESGRIPKGNLTQSDYFVWAGALRETKEYDRAINKYREGLDKDTTFCSGYDGIGFTNLLKYQAEMRPQHLDAAEKVFLQAIDCNHNDAVAYCDLGNVLVRKWMAGKKLDDRLIKRAIDLNQQALKIDPQQAEAAVNIGYVQYMSGQHQQALDYFQEIGQKFPKDAGLFLNLGYLSYREYLNGRSDLLQAAIDETRRACGLDPKSWAAANNLGFLYFETDDLPDAIKSWHDAHRLNPTEPDILAGLALGLFKSGQCGEAVEHYREAIRREAKLVDPEYLLHVHFWSKKAAQDVIPLVQAATSDRLTNCLDSQTRK